MVSSYKIDRRWRCCFLCLCLFVFLGKDIERFFFKFFVCILFKGYLATYKLIKTWQNASSKLIFWDLCRKLQFLQKKLKNECVRPIVTFFDYVVLGEFFDDLLLI